MNNQVKFYFHIYSFSKWEAINIYTEIIKETIIGIKNDKYKIRSFSKFNINEFLIIFLNLLKLILLRFYKKTLNSNFFIFGSFSILNILICILLSKLGYRTVFLIHDVNAHSGAGLKTFFTNLFTKIICNSKTKIVVFSNYSLKILNKKFSLARIDNHVIPLYSFLEESRFYKEIKINLLSSSSIDNSRIILFGRNEEYKGFDYIYNKAYKENIFRGKWMFLGSGMLSLSKKHQIETGKIFIKDCFYSREELIRYLKDSSLTLIAYKEMTQSAVIYDSMALGLDVFTLHYPFVDEVLGYPGLKIFKSKKLMFQCLRDYIPLTTQKRLKSIDYYQKNFSKKRSKLAATLLIDSLIKKDF